MTLPLATTAHDPRDTGLIQTLGYGGLIPFVGLAALLWLVDRPLQPWVGAGLAAYAALIVSFLGGVHWGIGWLITRRWGTPSPMSTSRPSNRSS